MLRCHPALNEPSIIDYRPNKRLDELRKSPARSNKNMIGTRVCLFVLFLGTSVCGQKDGSYEEPGHGSSKQFYKLGEFNDRCKATRDCRHFGYVCRDNRTCQCDFMYIPDSTKKTCVGGVNQRCIYDEHCIEGAFCMKQAMCKCKDSSPVELDDGLICSDGQATWTHGGIDLLILVAISTVIL